MKHIFVINPAAGKTNVTEALLPRLHALFVGREEELETYLTTGVGDATRFVKERCAASNGEHLRFYSCGGDGTMNEVLQGLAGCANAAMGVVPCGSGNDFVRSFPDCDFSNLEAQITAEERPIDLIHFNNQWSANICSAGLDSDVCKNMARYKRLPLVTGSGAYILALISTFFSPMGKQAHIVLDDGRVLDENILILVMSNGGFYGGGWNGAPKFNVEDGLMDLCIVRKINRLRILKVIGKYQKGLHVSDQELRKLVTYTRCRTLEVEYDQPVTMCVDGADGEMSESTHVDAAIVPLALPLILPRVKK